MFKVMFFFISTFHQRNQLLSTLGLQMGSFKGRCCTNWSYKLASKHFVTFGLIVVTFAPGQ